MSSCTALPWFSSKREKDITTAPATRTFGMQSPVKGTQRFVSLNASVPRKNTLCSPFPVWLAPFPGSFWLRFFYRPPRPIRVNQRWHTAVTGHALVYKDVFHRRSFPPVISNMMDEPQWCSRIFSLAPTRSTKVEVAPRNCTAASVFHRICYTLICKPSDDVSERLPLTRCTFLTQIFRAFLNT